MRLKALKADAKNNFINIITADESWYDWSYEYQSQWSISRATVPTRTLQKTDAKKSMLTLLLSGLRILTLDQLRKGQNLSRQPFVMLFSERLKKRLHLFLRKVELKG
jgi:hypothetical protein